MARITKAELRSEGEGEAAVLSVDVRLDWDRSDDDHQWQLILRFYGADAGVTGGDDVIMIHTVPVAPSDGDQIVVSLQNTDRVFDEDRGSSDEVYAECELLIARGEEKPVRTNKVKGTF